MVCGVLGTKSDTGTFSEGVPATIVCVLVSTFSDIPCTLPEAAEIDTPASP